MKIVAQDGGISGIEEVVANDGNFIRRVWAAKYGFKDRPIEGGPSMDAISIKKTNPNTIYYVIKKNGKEVVSGEWIISEGGKISHDIGGGKDAD